MLTKEITIPIPRDIFISLNEPEMELRKELQRLLAVQAYRQGKLTLGKAARLGGMTRLEFERFLSEHEIPISLLTLEDVHHDLQKLGA
ncbi:MAG: UPF0175 family protein [Candidatus Vecturithrix sp.]|jgi:predicted HTH domain antitoxin|nr:UPF0175 family protein [Candidatus Vecturithrix sp.]